MAKMTRDERENKRAGRRLERLQKRTAMKDDKAEKRGQRLVGKMETTPAERREGRKMNRQTKRAERKASRLNEFGTGMMTSGMRKKMKRNRG